MNLCVNIAGICSKLPGQDLRKKKLMNIKHSHGDVTPESHLPRRADSIVSLMLTLQIKKIMLPFFLVKLNHI